MKNVQCLVCLEAQKDLGTLKSVSLFGSQTHLICYGALKTQHWLLLAGTDREDATCTCAAGTWAHCLSAKDGEQQCNACGQWMMIHANRKLKSLGSKGILLVTFAPHIWSSWGLSHLDCMWNLFKYFYNFNLTLTSNLTTERGGGSFLCFFLFFWSNLCQILPWTIMSCPVRDEIWAVKRKKTSYVEDGKKALKKQSKHWNVITK